VVAHGVRMGRMQVRLERVRADAFRAVVGKRVVGSACAWEDCNGRFCILASYVRPDYRRRGIARSLYEAIESSCGRRLVPAASLSDAGFEFWQRFRPEAVSEDLRHVRAKLLGQKLEVRGRMGTVVEACGGVLTVQYEGAAEGSPNSRTCVVVRSIKEAMTLVLPLVGCQEEAVQG
jgi:GNAT superfamily N-acetyltransferase